MYLNSIFLSGRNFRKGVGFFLITASIAITFILWLATVNNYTFIYADPFLFLSKITIFIGIMSMCWTFLLATRAPFFDTLFGGLDKVYHVHKNMGKLSYVCVILHILFQCLRHVPNVHAIVYLFIPQGFGGLEFGVAAFVLFTLLLACTLWIDIPYHIWKLTHELFIFVLILSFLHIYYINKHVNASLVLSLWMYGWIALAFAGYMYIRFLYYYVGPRYTYHIDKIETLRAAGETKTWNIFFTTDARNMRYQPGQFVYISFFNSVVTPEIHPYSVSSAPGQSFLRLSIKNLGDHTKTLDHLQEGDKAFLWGPYGKLYEPYLYQCDKDAVMIAGGIGITPFLSMLGYEAHHPKQRKTFIFYCVKNSARADFGKELEVYASLNNNIHYIPFYAEQSGFISIEKVRPVIVSLQSKNFFLCGPNPMMNALIEQLKNNGVRNSNIHFEDFNFIG